MVFLLTAAPASRATFDPDLADSLLKQIYQRASDGDERVIYRIIRKALEAHPDEGLDLINKLIKELRNNSEKLHDSDAKKDLARVRRKLRNWLRSHRMPSHGAISTPESATTTR